MKLKLFLAAFFIQACLFAQGDKDYLVTIETPHGTMQAILYDETPLHKENFIKLIDESYYDSLLFHRVINQFMIQGGDPESKGASANKRLGTGGPKYKIPAEIKNGLYHKKGALSAARQGDQMNPQKKSSGSQFYIVHGKTYGKTELEGFVAQKANGKKQQLFGEYLRLPKNRILLDSLQQLQRSGDQATLGKIITDMQPLVDSLYEATGGFAYPEQALEDYASLGGTPHLDNEYTVFGEIVSGMDVIDKIAAVPTRPGDRPDEDVWMIITYELLKKKEITKKTGYQYEE